MKVSGNLTIDNLQQRAAYLNDIGAVDAYEVSFLYPITGYTDGLQVTFKAATSNTGPATLEVDGYGPVQIVKNVNQALGTGDISAGEIVCVTHDGTYFQMMDNPEQPLSPFSTFLIDGGQITWLNNFNYTVSAANYVILGSQYSSPQTNITLAPSDPTFDRFDLVVVDTNNSVQVITGIPSDPAQEPSYDPATQLPLAFINVPAGSTQPSCAFLYTVYQENAGTPTEWAAVSSSGTMVVNSTNNPRTGTRDIEGTAVASGATLTFTPATPFDSTNITNLVLYIRSKGSWGTTGSGQRFSIKINNSLGQIGIPVIIPPRGAFGFDSSTTGTYQQIVIDRDLFSISDGQSITSIVFTNAGTDGSMGFYLDDISIETGCVVQASPLFNNGLTRVGNTVQFGGSLIHLTTLQTGLNNMRFWGSTNHSYPYQFRTTVPPSGSTGIVSFGHNDNSPDAVTLGVNFNNGIASLYQTTFFGVNNVGYWLGTNVQGNSGANLKQDDNTSKNSLIYFHTLDEGLNIGGVDIYASPALGGTTIADMTPYLSAAFFTTGQIQFPRYAGGVFDDVPDRALGLDANGTIVTYTPGGGGSSGRFGVSGEDDTAAQTRDFDIAGQPFTIQGGRPLITYTGPIGSGPLEDAAALRVAVNASSSGGNSNFVGLSVNNTSTGAGVSNNYGVYSHVTGGSILNANFAAFPDVSTGYGLFIQATNDARGGLITNSGINYTLQIANSNGNAFFVQSEGVGTPIFGAQNKASDDIQPFMTFKRQGASVNSVPGVGGYFDVKMFDDASFTRTALKQLIYITDAGASTYETEYKFQLSGNNTLQDIITVNGVGNIQFNQYGSGGFTGTPTFFLAVDASGNVIERGAGSGRFGVSGEDDAAAQTRLFELDGNTLTIQNTGNSGKILNLQGIGDSNTGLDITLTTNNTNTGEPAIVIHRKVDGTPTDNLGLTVNFQIENESNVEFDANIITSILSDVTSGSERSVLSINGLNNGAGTNLVTLNGTGAVRFNQYGSGTFTGTPTKNLAVDSSGNVIEIAAPPTPLKEYTFVFSGNGTDDPTLYGTLINTLGTVDTFTYGGSTGFYLLKFTAPLAGFGSMVGWGQSVQMTNTHVVIDVAGDFGTDTIGIQVVDGAGVAFDPGFEGIGVTIKST